MNKTFWITLGGLLLSGQVYAVCGALAPYSVTMDMMSGTKRHAISTTTLSQPDGESWLYGTRSEAKSFLAKLAGARVFEETLFVVEDGQLTPLRYSYDRSTRVKSRKDVIEFDWDAMTASNSPGEKHWVLEIPDGALDEYLVNIALMRAMCAGQEELVFDVVDRKGRMEEQRFARVGEESVTTSFGTFETIKVERLRDTAERTTFLWFAPELGYLPVKIQHLEKGHDISAILTDYTAQ